MKKLILALGTAACIALSSAAAWAQEDELKSYPGYVDFGPLGGVFGEPTVEIAIGKSLLGFVIPFIASEEPEIANLFSRLEGVRVRVFETDSLADGAISFVRDVSSRLTDQGWESVVTVNSADEQVRIFMKLNEEIVEGLTVMAVEEHEAAFINIIGFLDPAELSRLMDHLDVEVHGVEINGADLSADADDE